MHMTQVASIHCGARTSTPASRNNIFCGHWSQFDRLLEQTVEQQSTRSRRAAVETECEFVHVVVQIVRLNRSLVRAKQPALQQRSNSVGQRQEIVAHLGCGPSDRMLVTQLLQ